MLFALAACAFGAPKTPLGTYARTGIPVVLTSEAPITVDLSGWKWRVDGTTVVAPPRVPCSVRFGPETLALRAVPDGKLLVGVVGPGQVPASDRTLVERIRLIDGIPWAALDLFDRIVWTGVDRPTDPQRELLLRWVRMGGDLVAPRGVFTEDDTGLGRIQSVRSQKEASVVAQHPIPRVGNVLPEIYDLAPARGAGSPALHELRLVFLGVAAVLLLGLLGGAGGWIGRRLFFGGTLAVVIVGCALGVWLTRRTFEPFAEAYIEVVYFPAEASEYSRVRLFRIARATGEGAERVASDGIPLFYRGAGEPWWTDRSGRMQVDEGVSRAFSTDRIAVGISAGEAGGGEPRRLTRLLRRVAPDAAQSGWQWGPRVLRPPGKAALALLTVEVVAVR